MDPVRSVKGQDQDSNRHMALRKHARGGVIRTVDRQGLCPGHPDEIVRQIPAKTGLGTAGTGTIAQVNSVIRRVGCSLS